MYLYILSISRPQAHYNSLSTEQLMAPLQVYATPYIVRRVVHSKRRQATVWLSATVLESTDTTSIFTKVFPSLSYTTPSDVAVAAAPVMERNTMVNLVAPTPRTLVTSLVSRADPDMEGTPTSTMTSSAPILSDDVLDTTNIFAMESVPSTTASVQAATAAVTATTDASIQGNQGLPPMSIALLVMAGILIVVVFLLGLGCWMKRRKNPPPVDEMVEVDDESVVDEPSGAHEPGHQRGNSRTYRSISRTNISCSAQPSRSVSRSTNTSSGSRPHRSKARATTIAEPRALPN